MRKLAVAVLLIVIGVVLGLFLRAHRIIEYPAIRHKLGGDNDPPVTVSDSSLHARSPHLWQADADGGKTIRPNGTKLQDTCGFEGLATFNYMDRDYDFSPTAAAWLITLTYADDTVTIGSDGSLKIVSAKYYFDPAPADDKGHRKHHIDDGKTTHITAIGVAEPVDMDIDTAKNGHFKIRFCYQ
jgi:hypothetical protein